MYRIKRILTDLEINNKINIMFFIDKELSNSLTQLFNITSMTSFVVKKTLYNNNYNISYKINNIIIDNINFINNFKYFD